MPSEMASRPPDAQGQDGIQALAIPAALVDRRARIVVANEALERLLGYSQGGLRDVPLDALVSLPEGGIALVGPGAPLGPAQQSRDLIHRDQSRVGAAILLTPLGKGDRLMHVIAHSDTGDAAEIRRLKEMGDFRARFLNIAAHELKTPLTPIRIQIQLLQSYLKDASQPVSQSLGVLARSVDRLNTLVDDVLDAARAQASRLQVKLQPVSLSTLLEDALESYLPVADEVGLVLQPAVTPGVVVMGDRARLMQVFNNLLSNGVKFTPMGGRLDVSVTAEDPWAVVRIRDTGRGMTPEQLSRLFQPFAQVHEDLQGTKKGTGLGLYITKSIIDQHGGRIEIGSPGPGAGTLVVIRLPRTDQPPTPVAAPEAGKRRPQLRDRLRDMV